MEHVKNGIHGNTQYLDDKTAPGHYLWCYSTFALASDFSVDQSLRSQNLAHIVKKWGRV
jgi:hypothetical protein